MRSRSAWPRARRSSTRLPCTATAPPRPVWASWPAGPPPCWPPSSLPGRAARTEDLPAALEASLARLGRDRVDLYQHHYPSRRVDIARLMHLMAAAVAAGKVTAVGVSNYSAAQMRLAHAALADRGVALASNQVQYSLLHRDPETNGVLDACRELGVTLIAYQPLASGALTGKYVSGPRPRGLRRFTPYLPQEQHRVDRRRRRTPPRDRCTTRRRHDSGRVGLADGEGVGAADPRRQERPTRPPRTPRRSPCTCRRTRWPPWMRRPSPGGRVPRAASAGDAGCRMTPDAVSAPWAGRRTRRGGRRPWRRRARAARRRGPGRCRPWPTGTPSTPRPRAPRARRGSGAG